MNGAIASMATCLLVAILLPMGITAQDAELDATRGADDPELDVLLERTGERVRQFYLDLQKLAWTTAVRLEVLEEDGSPRETPLELVFESIVRIEPAESDDSPLPFFVREVSDLELVDGESVGPDYELESDRPFPRPYLPALLFLLPEARAANDYSFSYAGRADLDGRPAHVVDVAYPRSADDEPRIVWRGGEFSIYNLVWSNRIWIDPETYDVLRFDRQTEPASFSHLLGLVRISFESGATTRFTTIEFDDGQQVFLVPETFEYNRAIKGARRRPYVRTVQSFTDYRRFTGEVRISPFEDPE